MKRILVTAAVVILTPIVVLASVVAYAFIGRQAVADGFEAGDVRIIKEGGGSIGIVPVGSREVAIVDAGNDKSGEALLAELARRKLDAGAVTAIFLTHGHPDHTGAVALFPNAAVMALAPEVGLIEGTARPSGPLTRFMPLAPAGKVTRMLADGETVTVGYAEVHVYAMPGHTQGSAAYLVGGVLFMGDAADADSNGRVIAPPWIFSDSQPQASDSIVTLADRLRKEKASVRTIAFAHSGVRTEGLAPLVAFAEGARR